MPDSNTATADKPALTFEDAVRAIEGGRRTRRAGSTANARPARAFVCLGCCASPMVPSQSSVKKVVPASR